MGTNMVLNINMLFFIILSGVRLSPLGTAATTGLLYQPRMIDDVDCGAVGGMKIGKWNRSTLTKPAPVPLCPNPTWPDPDTNPGRRGEKPATNRTEANQSTLRIRIIHPIR
jgi:hypothetical protein